MKTKQRIELAASWKPESPEHAVKCLKSWVEQWQVLVKDTVKLPWSHQKFGDADKDIYIYGKTVYDQGSDHESGFIRIDYDDVDMVEAERTAKLVVALGPMVQGMMAGIKAVINEYEVESKIKGGPDPLFREGWLVGVRSIKERSVIKAAEAYGPWLVKAGMTVPEC